MSHTSAYIQLISFDFGAPNTAFDVSKRPYFDNLLQKKEYDFEERQKLPKMAVVTKRHKHSFSDAHYDDS